MATFDELVKSLGPDVLQLNIGWHRKGKLLSGETQHFRVIGRGRVQCPYCAREMPVKQMIEHYIPCRAEQGDW